MDDRINARLDEASARRLAELTTGTGKSVSRVVREAIAVYHAQMVKPRPKSKFLALAGTGNSGRSDGSANVKAIVADLLEAKYGLAPVAPPAAPAAPASRRRRR
jgi:hypothetical protein